MKFPVLYEDRHLVVLDKPTGIPVTPSREGGDSIETQTGLLVCHRLDADTSGCLVLARTADAQRKINQAFAGNSVQKTYLALAEGSLPDRGEVRLPIGIWRRGRVSVGDGKPAHTRYEVRHREGTSLAVLAWPITGRTHQIRAHLSAAGAPLLGDPLYGGPEAERLMLHAIRIELSLPTGRLVVASPIPYSFLAANVQLQKGWLELSS